MKVLLPPVPFKPPAAFPTKVLLEGGGVGVAGSIPKEGVVITGGISVAGNRNPMKLLKLPVVFLRPVSSPMKVFS